MSGKSLHTAAVEMPNHRSQIVERNVLSFALLHSFFGLRHLAYVERIEFVRGESAKIAFGVADVRDGKLQIAGAAVVQDLAQELKRAFFGPRYRLGKVARGRRRIGFRFGRRRDCGRVAHVQRDGIVRLDNKAGNSSF